MKAAHKGTKRRPTRKPRALVEQAGAMHICGDSNRQIARRLHVKAHTVPHMLADSQLLKQYQKQLAAKVPAALETIDLLLHPGPKLSPEELGRNLRWLLEGTRVAVRKQEIDDKSDPLASLTHQELIDRLRAQLADLAATC